MPPSEPLALVLQMAKEAEQQAVMRFKAAQTQLKKVQHQLAQLAMYRDDTAKQLSSRLTVNSSINALSCQQFVGFIQQLDKALREQQQAIDTCQQICTEKQQEWCVKQEYRKMIEGLLEKKQRQIQLMAERQEVKLIDELVARQWFYKRLK